MRTCGLTPQLVCGRGPVLSCPSCDPLQAPFRAQQLAVWPGTGNSILVHAPRQSWACVGVGNSHSGKGVLGVGLGWGRGCCHALVCGTLKTPSTATAGSSSVLCDLTGHLGSQHGTETPRRKAGSSEKGMHRPPAHTTGVGSPPGARVSKGTLSLETASAEVGYCCKRPRGDGHPLHLRPEPS